MLFCFFTLQVFVHSVSLMSDVSEQCFCINCPICKRIRSLELTSASRSCKQILYPHFTRKDYKAVETLKQRSRRSHSMLLRLVPPCNPLRARG